MDNRKIYVIYNTDKFTKEDIVEDIRGEGYKHQFLFCDGLMIADSLKYADEVWTWGDCSTNVAYGMAKDLNKDIWEMK